MNTEQNVHREVNPHPEERLQIRDCVWSLKLMDSSYFLVVSGQPKVRNLLP
jgi:hypothetical protein